jgi:hypothetical protein
MATNVLRDAQPDAHAIRGYLSREKGSGRSRRAVGSVGATRDAILRARDGIPLAPVSGLETISGGACCARA